MTLLMAHFLTRFGFCLLQHLWRFNDELPIHVWTILRPHLKLNCLKDVYQQSWRHHWHRQCSNFFGQIALEICPLRNQFQEKIFLSFFFSNMSLNTAHQDQYNEENGIWGQEDENRNLCSRKNDQSIEKMRDFDTKLKRTYLCWRLLHSSPVCCC